MDIIQHSADIWTIPNFISARICEDLILYSEMKGYQPAEVSLSTGAKMMKNIRNNQRLLYTDTALAQEYWARLAPFCPQMIAEWQAIGLNEQFRFYKYESAERFKRHIDGRFRRSPEEESRITFMIYLNHDFEGGHTDFDNVSIKPETGDALCFIHEQKHEGCPVLSGTKYVLRSDVMYRKNDANLL